jgi:segregation and condensation protein A
MAAELLENEFSISLSNFEGPFDLLLQLISKHKLDITEVALGSITDEFISFIKDLEGDSDSTLNQITEFLVVAATLLDLKAARLLPSGEVEDEGDLALLEARDLLFARLLQYRAFKEISAVIAAQIAAEERFAGRKVALEPYYANLLPEVFIGLSPERFAQVAAKALAPKRAPILPIEHIHAPLVSVREEAERVVARLRKDGRLSFRTLIADAEGTLTIIARFLALLELYREGVLRFEQVVALGELQVTWVGEESGSVEIKDEFDEPNEPDEPDEPSSDVSSSEEIDKDGENV